MTQSLRSHSVLSPTPCGPDSDLEYVVCDYCGTDRTRRLATLPPVEALPLPMHRLGASALRLGGERIHFCQCKTCGLVYMNPRLTEAAIARFYDTVYGTQGASEGFESDQRARAAHILDVVTRLLSDAGDRRVSPSAGACPQVLDIGCGAGQLLQEAQRRGWEVRGTELSQVAAQHASQVLGVPIHCGDFRELGLPAGSLDLVVMQAVVEHLRAPIDFLRDSAALLRPGGVLFFSVPNVVSAEHRLARLLGQPWRGFIVEHLYYFTPAFLRRLTADLGLEIAFMSSWNPLSRWPNPWRDLRRVGQGTPASEPHSAPATPLPPFAGAHDSLAKRALRQATNYLFDIVSKVSEGRRGGASTSGNVLFVWARKPR
jgi:SAM-dependent methyltransferase